MYSYDEVMTFVEEEDVKFIRLAFCDVFGRQKNLSIMPSELKRAFEDGVSFDASAIAGFGTEQKSDLFLHPDPSTLSILPWRPAHGRVVRMFCDVSNPDGTPFQYDGRYLLKSAVKKAEAEKLTFNFGSEIEFYLFKNDENGDPTEQPFDRAGYMDIAPADKGETVRREICFTLLDMGITPECSHHEEGPGQNEIDFKYSDALTGAENAVNFKNVVETIAMRNGLAASFEPKPLPDEPGNGLHINISVDSSDGKSHSVEVLSGILAHIREITAFLNPSENSYLRLGSLKAPRYVTWSHENRSQLIRIPAAAGEYKRLELRSPDPMANPYLAYTLLIEAGLDGIKRKLPLPPAHDINLFIADEALLESLEKLPYSYAEALSVAKDSEFVKSVLPEGYIDCY